MANQNNIAQNVPNPSGVFRPPHSGTTCNDRFTLEAIFDQLQPQTVFEMVGEGSAVVPELTCARDARVICLRPAGGDGSVQGPVTGKTWAQQQVQYLAGDIKTFDFSRYYKTMDLVVLDAASGQDDLLRDSMHAFKMIKPHGGIVWRRPAVLDKERRMGFDRISVRFPLRHLVGGGLTLYGLPDLSSRWEKSRIDEIGSVELSVIIPTFNGGDRLGATLESALNQTLPMHLYEIIVVDNKCTSRTKKVAKSFIKGIGDRVRYLREPTPGLVNARHAGARAARGAILCYLDDDALAAPTWLASIREAFNNADVGLVGGKILPRYEIEPPPWLDRFWYVTNSGKSLGMLSLIDFGNRGREINADYVWGCNYAVRKDILMESGGFHPDAFPGEFIRYRGDGEVGLSRKISELGYRAWYHPLATVHHIIPANRLDTGYFCRRQFNQGISDSFAIIRKEGLPERCDLSHDLLQDLKRFVENDFSHELAPIEFNSAEFDQWMQISYEYGRLYHIYQVVSDPKLYDHVCRKDYLEPMPLAPSKVDLSSDGSNNKLSAASVREKATDNYRAGLWLAEIGLHSLAVNMLDCAIQGGLKPAGTNFIRGLSLMETGRFNEAEIAIGHEPQESPFREQIEAMRHQIRTMNSEARMRLLTRPQGDAEKEISRLPLTLGSAVIYITERCNSRCITCNAWRKTAEKQLTTETWMQILSQLRASGISAVEFVGGEPLLRPDLPLLIAGAKDLGFCRIIVSSNGFLLDPVRMKQLTSAGVNGYHISLDGFDDTYRELRGRDWFERIRQTLNRLAKTGKDLLVLTTLNRRNLDELSRIVAFVNGIGARWFPNILENGKYLFKGIDTEDIAITAREDIERLRRTLDELLLRYPGVLEAGTAEIEYIIGCLENPDCEQQVPCTLGYDSLYLDPAANLYPACMSLKPVGNLLKTNLSALVESDRMRRRLQAMVRRHCPGCTCGYSQRAQYMQRMRHRI